MEDVKAARAIVFDLDGTLIDSAPDIHAAVNQMLTGEGLAPLDLATVISFVGNGLPKLVERVMRARGIAGERHGDLTQVTLDFYKAASSDLTRPYPNMVTALERLQDDGFAMGVCTNKPEAPARQILEDMELIRFFGAVLGGDSLPVKKPDPAPLRATFRALGVASGLFVGDSEVDAATAEAAGVDFALFTLGYRKTPVADLTHSHAFSDFSALPGIAERVFRAAAE